MSRVVRINELVLRELSELLHTRYQDQAVKITFTEVQVSPDLHVARVYYSVLGDALARYEAEKFLEGIKGELRSRMSKRVILKYTPALEFEYDESMIRGNRTLAILDDLESKGEFKPEASPPAPPPAS